LKHIVYKILWSTIEDFVGLWEILWELNSVLPEKSRKENQENAKLILRYFLEQKLVTFYFNKWGSDELEVLPYNRSMKLLDDEKFWDAPALKELCIKIGNTGKGEQFYNEKLVDGIM